MSELDYSKLCKFCFQVLESYLQGKDINQVPFPSEFKGKSYPLFVTWTTGKEKDLRGCIGTFKEDNLEKNLRNYTIISSRDSRFPHPIMLNELPNLNCEVSLLVNFEEAKNPYDWEVGKHGIQIYFEENGQHSATFLPEVPIEHNMDKKTTLQHLIEKAGYHGKLSKVDKKIKMRRYQSIKIFMSYKEYLNYKKNEKIKTQDL